MRTWIQRLVGTVVATGTAAANLSAAPLPGFALSGETAHVAVYARPGQKADAAGVGKQLARIAHNLGVVDIQRADYYHYDEAADLMAVTGRYAGGVTYPARHQVHSTKESRDHELVHLVAFQLGSPGAFFQEGLAVVLGDRGRYQGRSVDGIAKPWARRASLPALIAAFDAEQPGQGYAIAGSFMKWLVERHSLPKVTEFFRASQGQSPANAFHSVFGLSLAEAGAQWARQV
jgi:hypothetical protein